jgi:hypothetical protein
MTLAALPHERIAMLTLWHCTDENWRSAKFAFVHDVEWL